MLEQDRKQAGWSVGQAAWALGVSIREYREIEAGGVHGAWGGTHEPDRLKVRPLRVDEAIDRLETDLPRRLERQEGDSGRR